MSNIRDDLVNAAIDRACVLVDYNVYDDIHKRYEFEKQTVLADKSITENEKSEAIKELTKMYDEERILHNEGIKRICENCNKECLAILFCEHCVRNYLKANFLNWTSGNDDIDDLIQECQMKIMGPHAIPEWISYNNLENIEYLTKGECSEIYTAIWIDGHFIEWDSNEKQLKRFGKHLVVLKKLKNVENASKSWFKEAKSHLIISNKYPEIVQCFGLTQDPSNGSYMLVMNKLDINLRNYLQQNNNQLTWKKRIQIATHIIYALEKIHSENAIHKNLHSAPEVIVGNEQTFKSDIYSIAMLMWEISSGHSPFSNYEHNYNLAMSIVNGIRPKIVPGTPFKYKNLIKQCWDADPSKRPNANTLLNEIYKLNLYYQNKSDDLLIQSEENNNLEINNASNLKDYTSTTSQIYQFENLPEPRNATKEELEAFYNKSFDFNIPDNVDDFGKSSNQKNRSRISGIFRVGSKKLFKVFKNNSKNGNQNDYKKETEQQKVENDETNFDDKDDIYNNPNLHPEEQKEFEIPDDV
ncbi:kinase-like domain-containing protein [Rhizophagus clarus]|uniref:Kinase-like domain-containing protein n=1 Tax=Rhizophagus clarus TaxID=94130 RepID=A0A8H3QDM1_9GLOM|nr:kinase-like domain-containing protein [Rhizophagus clarus]